MDKNEKAKANAQTSCDKFIANVLDGTRSIWDDGLKRELLEVAYKAQEKQALEKYDEDDEAVAKKLSKWRAKYGY